MIRAALLDVDGTLVDSNDAHARAWVEVFLEFGRSVPFERVRPLIGKGGDKLVQELIAVDPESAEGQRLQERRSEIFRDRFLPQLRAFPRAQELVARMRSDGLRVVVATSAKQEEMHALLEICGVAELVSGRTSSDDVEQSKPDPDIVAAALSRAGVARHEALMLGDTPYDIEAARRVGVGTVGLRSGGWDDAALRGAVAIYEDASDLLAHYPSSPFVG